MSADAAVLQAIDLYRALDGVLVEIRDAVVSGRVERLEALVSTQEEMLARIARLELSEQAQPQLVEALQSTATEAMRHNTENTVLLSEQIALIHETMKAILGDQKSLNRLA